jgi:hypothetical protein
MNCSIQPIAHIKSVITEDFGSTGYGFVRDRCYSCLETMGFKAGAGYSPCGLLRGVLVHWMNDLRGVMFMWINVVDINIPFSVQIYPLGSSRALILAKS